MSLRVFIVEDDADTLKSVKAFIERRGHNVQCATGMQSAIARIKPQDYDLLLSDIGLPYGDGWELMRWLKPHTLIYAAAMSGYGTAADINHSKEVGYDCHLVKPLTKEALDEMLAHAQEAKNLASETARLQTEPQ